MKAIITFCLIFLFAQISINIPGFEIPITLQTVAITALPIIWRKKAVYGIIIYLLLGAIGLPIFSEFSGGISIFYGKSGGFLIGFLVAAIIIAAANIKVNQWPYQILLMSIGHIVIIFLGLAFIKLFIAPSYSIITFIQSFGSALIPKIILGLMLIYLIGKIELFFIKQIQ